VHDSVPVSDDEVLWQFSMLLSWNNFGSSLFFWRNSF
jgi:hypothetical protein